MTSTLPTLPPNATPAFEKDTYFIDNKLYYLKNGVYTPILTEEETLSNAITDVLKRDDKKDI